MSRDREGTGAGGEGTLLVVTDLDGTLLDQETYGFEPARPALEALARRGVPLVLATSKTSAEVEPLARQLGLRPALIVENGGAVLVPRAIGGYDSTPLGVGHAELRRQLAEIAREVAANLRGLSSCPPTEVSRLTGLDERAARRALARAHDEPFLLEDESKAPAVAAAAARRGLRVTHGGRFFHLTGDIDKGSALRHLLARLPHAERLWITVGLGDAANDLPLLRAVERPILMPRRDGRLDDVLAAALPGAEQAPAPGPAGWNAAVLVVLAGGRLPAVSRGRGG